MNLNTLVISIINSYPDTNKNLPGVEIDNSNIITTLELLGVKHFCFKNYNENKLNQVLELINQMATAYTQLLLIYSGHGFYSETNKFCGIVTNDSQKINTADLLAKLASFKDIVCVIDACQTINIRSEPLSISQIQNEQVLMLYPTEIGTTALCHNVEGSYLINAICNEMKTNEFQQIFSINGLVTAFAHRMCIIALKYYKNIGKIRTCKFSANRNFRNKYSEYCNLMKKTVNQKQINDVTVHNGVARQNHLTILKAEYEMLRKQNALKKRELLSQKKVFNLFKIE